jgi:malate dehydrogenase
MVGAIASDAQTAWPASVLLDGEYGLHGISLSVPVALGRGGVTTIHEWRLDQSEKAALCQAAEVVREQADAIRLDGDLASRTTA